MKTEEILARLQKVEPNGKDSWMACCPAHEDNTPSLSVRHKDRKTVVHCFAGCEFPAIAKALQLTTADFFDEPLETTSRGTARSSGKPQFVAFYNYRDEHGELRYQAVRKNPKGFAQRRPDGNDGWIWNLDGVTPLPYRLPELLVAPLEQTVFITEGEKDADRLANLGLVSTCNSGGAKKWRAELSQFFTGRRVVILPDNDKAGREHVEVVGHSLQGIAESIRVLALVGLPEKGDVSDWLDAGHKKQELLELAENAPHWTLPPIKQTLEQSEQEAAGAMGTIPAVTVSRGRTDLANAERLVARYGDVVRYVFPWGKFLVWDGTRWRIDDSGEIYRRGKAVAKSLWKELPKSENRKQASEAAAFILKSSSRSGIGNMIELARSEPGIPVQPAELDTDPWLLNCANGTVDLRTGEIRRHAQADKITKLCATPFEPDATSVVWLQFLESILPDPGVRLFLQRYLGYCLTGNVSEQILAIFWGSGSNGKSTLLNAVMDVLGSDYAMKADQKLIVSRRDPGHSTERMDLFGKRFVITSETEDGERLAESQIKDLTGGEVIRGRRMREDSWEYLPTHKLVLATNHRPEILGTDHAIWRRLRLIPFEQRFVRQEDAGKSEGLVCDPTLAEKLSAVRPAILAWMVEGCLDWQRNGLPAPEAIKLATAEYRTDQDRVAAFIEEKCLISATAKTRSSQIYDAYSRWSEANGENPLTQTKFSRRLKDSFKWERSNGIWIKGIGIKVSSP